MDTFVAWAALLFSGISLFVSLRVQKKQQLLVDQELGQHERAARERVQADVRAELVRGGTDRIVITNHGPAEARDVGLAITSGNSPLLEGDADRKLPVRVLLPGGTAELVAGLSGDCYPPFEAVITWLDGSGRRTREATLA